MAGVAEDDGLQLTVGVSRAQDGDAVVDDALGVRVVAVAVGGRRAAVHREAAVGVAVIEMGGSEGVEGFTDDLDDAVG